MRGRSKSILGIAIDTYRKRNEYQITPEVNWSNTENYHVRPICLFDVSNTDELKEAFCGKSTQPFLKKDHLQKGTKYSFLKYQLQFIKAFQFIQLDEERFNENFL